MYFKHAILYGDIFSASSQPSTFMILCYFQPSKLKLPARPPRLQRTLSDESLCSTQLNRNQQTYGQEVFSADVLFGANKLSSSRENLDRVHR